MKWQEYQEAVSLLYEQAEGIGQVSRNISLPDKITRQSRQIDTLIEIETKGHSVRIIVDAKYHSTPLDINDIDGVIALSKAVGAQKAIIVAANGWTQQAETKADFESCDLRILSTEDALDLLVPDKWSMCPQCKKDCIINDQDGALIIDGLIFWWIAGQCRSCSFGIAWCQECGLYLEIPVHDSIICTCGHEWFNTKEGIDFILAGET